MPVFPFHELRRAAWNLASGNVRPGEDVLVVASSDQEPALVDALVAAADAAGAGTATAAVIACPADMADYRHPAPVVAAAERAGLTVVATSIRFPRAYDDLSRALFAAGRRQVLINNAPLVDFVRGAALADPADAAGAHAQARRRGLGRTHRPGRLAERHRPHRPRLPALPAAHRLCGGGHRLRLLPERRGHAVAGGGQRGGRLRGRRLRPGRLSGGRRPAARPAGGPRSGWNSPPAGWPASPAAAAAGRLEAVLAAADGNARLLAELGLGTNARWPAPSAMWKTSSASAPPTSRLATTA